MPSGRGGGTDELFPTGLLPDEMADAITRYAFDLSGPKYAEYMRQSMQDYLRARGELPAGMTLGHVEQYKKMTGQGEVWVDASGLPLRQIIHISFPPEKRAKNWVEADITTDFSNWGPESSASLFSSDFWQDPYQFLNNPGESVGLSQADAQHLGNMLGFFLLLVGMAALTITHRRSRLVQVPLVGAMIFSMIVTPLLQTQQVSAFYDRIESRQPQSETEQELGDQDSNPHKNPLSREPQRVALANVLAPNKSTTHAPSAATTQTLTDPQGVTIVCVITATDHCDEDGIDNQIEIFELGTWVDNVDSDSDGLSDYAEIQPVSVGGQTWYLDPLKPDTNQDGLLDISECPGRHDVVWDSNQGKYILDNSGTNACPDTDGDSVPDFYDHDNDGDGVPDSVDSSPNGVKVLGSNSSFELKLENASTDRGALVEFQIRPKDQEHLWWVNNVLNWPSQDDDGQIRRMTSDTMGDGDGDMILSPVLEIEIPWDANNRDRHLPTQAGVVSSQIDKTTPLTNWLDITKLEDDYGISASLDDSDGTIRLYVPVVQVLDPVGGAPVAFSARMLYQSSSAQWSTAHTIRLLWLVNMQNDTCSATTATPNPDCSDANKWSSSEMIVQTYYDDFDVTGLSVQEGNDAEVLIVGRTSGIYNSNLWHLADTVKTVYLGSQRKTDGGSRITLTDIKNKISGANNPWGLASSLYADHQTIGNANANPGLDEDVEMVKLLNGSFITDTFSAIPSTPSEGEIRSLLYVSEQANRTVSMTDTTTFTGDVATLTFDTDSSLIDTYGTLRWNSYEYSAALGWQRLSLADQLDELADELDSIFTATTLNGIVTGNESIDDVEVAKRGAIYAAQSYFMPFAVGSSLPLEIAATTVGQTTLVDNDHQLASGDQPVVEAVAGLLTEAQRYFEYISLANLEIPTADDEWGVVANETWAKMATSSALILAGMGDVALGNRSNTESNAVLMLQEYPKRMISSEINDTHALGYMATSLIPTMTDYVSNDSYGSGGNLGGLFLSVGYGHSFSGASGNITAMMDFHQSLSKAAGSGKQFNSFRDFVKFTKVAEAAKSYQRISDFFGASDIFGFALDVGTVGLHISLAHAAGDVNAGSPYYQEFLALQVATLYTSVITAVIGATGIGSVVLAIIGLIDLLIVTICVAVHSNGGKVDKYVDKWVCDGLMGTFTQALTYVIADYTPLVDLENKERLAMSLNTPTFATPTGGTGAEGIVVGNEVTLSAVITSTLYRGSPNWMGEIYAWQLWDQYLDNASFEYRLQESEADFSLDRGQGGWIEVEGRKSTANDTMADDARFYQVFTPALTYGLPTPGINQGQDLYLSEGFAMEAQNCWMIPNPTFVPPLIPVCWLNEYEDSFHHSLAGEFVFDILPATLDEFHSLTEVNNDSYRFDWDAQFPIIADADNDGLRAKEAGGIDPNDSKADSDGDGLSDWFEEYSPLGFDSEHPDADCDGLTDYWEALYGTDPARQDTDNDGLWDSAEMLHPNKINPYENRINAQGNSVPDSVPACAPTDASTVGSFIGGWEIVYDYDQNDNPIYLWVNANPTNPDTDNDTITDNAEEVYGYHPGVASTLNVLSLDSTIQTQTGFESYVTTQETITYTATVGNELRNRYAHGLLQSEFPVDVVQETKAFGTLDPLAEVTMNGAVDVDVTSSLATSMTLRAGAILAKESEDLLLHLPMNEPVGATTFHDLSLPNYDFVCSTAGCPTANGSYLEVGHQQSIENWDPALRESSSLTVAAWVKGQQGLPTDAFVYSSGSGLNILVTGARIRVISSSGDVIESTHPGYATKVVGDDTAAKEAWLPPLTHIAVTADPQNGDVDLYVDGQWMGNKKWLLAPQTGGSAKIGGADSNASIEIHSLQVYGSVLSALEIRTLAGYADMQLGLTETTEIVTCSGTRCPNFSSSGATFDQRQHVSVEHNALALTKNEFTFFIWLDPKMRNAPFEPELDDESLVDYRDNDKNSQGVYQDWQGVFGYQDKSNDKKIYPSMFVSNHGRLRMIMGDGTNTCAYTSAPNLITYDEEDEAQYVTVTYDGTTFVLYINGLEEDRGAPTDCASVDLAGAFGSWNELYIGRPNSFGYLWFDNVWFYEIIDFGDSAEYCLNLDSKNSSGKIWWDFDVPEKVRFSEDIKKLRMIDDDDSSHEFWFFEDDVGSDDCLLHDSSDDLQVNVVGINNANLSGSHSSYFDDQLGDEGNLHWSVSNDFFVGELSDFHKFSSALSSDLVSNIFRDRNLGLKMSMDEAPDQNQFTDISTNHFSATCSTNSCPDSGIPGRFNQALRFDGGNADDDGYDGVMDYLTLAPSEEELGLDGNDFTIMAWVKPDALDDWHRILGASRANSVNGIAFGFDGRATSKKLNFVTHGVQSYEVVIPNDIVGRWSHVAVAFDSGNDATFYLNGQKWGNEIEGSNPASSNADDPYLIGASTDRNSSAIRSAFDGLIDDLRIVKYALLEEEEIQAIMHEAPILNLHLDEDLHAGVFVSDSPLIDNNDNMINAECSEDTCPGAGDKGQIREAAVFDGLNDRLKVDNVDSKLDLEKFTIALWVKPTQIKNQYQVLIAKGNDLGPANRNYSLHVNRDDMKIHYGLWINDCSTAVNNVSDGAMLQNQWNHVVMTYNDL
ncbi:hypothetical protein KFU94_36775 [Chloroflexi bacterium TSY]|nr:hypothetical protein [Chloroflexi bacterium TSY]